MSRPRKPLSSLLPDTLKKNRKRYAGRLEAQNVPLLPANAAPPAYFSAEEKAVWKEIKAAVPAGLLTAMDCFALEQVCVLVAKMRDRSIKSSKWIL